MTGRPIRVVQVLSSGRVGGTERMVSALAGAMDARTFESHVTVPDASGPIADVLRAHGTPLHELPPPHAPLRTARRLAALIDEWRFDVVHLYGLRMSLIGRAARRLAVHRPRIVIGIRGLHLADWPEADSLRTGLAIRVERALSRGVDLYVANSRSGARFLIERGLPSDRFRVIPNGIDVDFWSPAADRAASDPPLIACVANLRPVKRLDLAIEAAAALRGLRDGGFHLVLVGEGPLRVTLREQVRRLGLDAQVTLAGELKSEQVRDLLRRANLALLTSAWEGMPGSVLEAMACAVPVVATDVPGLADVVRHEVTGLLAPPEPAAIARACERILANPPLAARLGSAAREIAVRDYSLERMTRDYESLYLALVRPSGAAA